MPRARRTPSPKAVGIAKPSGKAKTSFGVSKPVHRPLLREDWVIVNIATLGRLEGNIFDPETLLALGVLENLGKGVKILGSGDLGKKITVRAHAFSESAWKKIEEAGGRAEVLAWNGPEKASPGAIKNEVIAHALETFGSVKKANHWLDRPNSLLRGETPRKVMKSDPSEVEAALTRIDHGVYI